MYVHDVETDKLNSYILFYDDETLKRENKIRVYYADKSQKDIEYSEDNIKKLNNIMENQIKRLPDDYAFELDKTDDIVTFGSYPITLLLVLNILAFRLEASFLQLLCMTVNAYFLSTVVGQKIMLDYNLNDLNKNQMFLEDKRLFEKLDKTNPAHLKHVSGKAKKKILDSNRKPILNINTINDINYADLLDIRENLNKYFDKPNGFSHTYRF